MMAEHTARAVAKSTTSRAMMKARTTRENQEPVELEHNPLQSNEMNEEGNDQGSRAQTQKINNQTAFFCFCSPDHERINIFV